jgi:DNA-binding NarL/FixJ family response regulator
MEMSAAPALETFAVEPAAVSPLDLLSSCERDVVMLALEGATDFEIAVRLGVSLRTTKDRLRRAFRKLGVRNRINLNVVLMFAESPRAAAAEPLNPEKIQ